MIDKRCYYDVLGVGKDASNGEIRKAYKRLALQFHPDRNKADDATDKFKEVTEAFQVLNDDDKRQRYDRFGHAGVEGQVGGFDGDFFAHVQDMFSDFFGGFGGFGGAQRGRRGGGARGRDLRVQQQLTLEEAVLGCRKEIDITSPVECGTCGGSGATPGTKPTTCATCRGAGQVSTGRGFIMFSQTCPACQGQGSRVDSPCGTCDGAGWEEKRRSVTVSFPAGIDEGHRLRVTGQGMPGARGGPAGHLYVDVVVAKHERFERDGLELVCRHTISFPEAALGTTAEIELLDGSVEKVQVEPGTQPGSVISRPGRGAPNVNGGGRGSLHVVIQVEVPRKPSRKAKKLLEQLAEEL